MKRWRYNHSADRQDIRTKYQNKDNPDRQKEEMELYLSQLEEAYSPVVVKRISRKSILILGLFVTLALSTTLFFLLGGGKRLTSALSSSSNSMDTYVKMEEAYADSIDKLLTMGLDTFENFKAKNTHWTGNAGIDYINKPSSIPPKFSYRVDGYLTKDFLSTNLDLSLNDTHIGTKIYYTYPESNSLYFYYPEYYTKPTDLQLVTQNNSSSILKSLPTFVPLVKKYYKELIGAISKDATISSEEEVDYKVGSLSMTCSSYKLTLTAKQVSKIATELFLKLSVDNELPMDKSELSGLLQAFFTNISYNPDESILDMNLDGININMTVYYKDDKILGRNIDIEKEHLTSSLFIGGLQIKNNYAFDIYAIADKDFIDNQAIAFHLSTHNFHNTYSGSISFSSNANNFEGSFSQVKLGSGNSLSPISGELNINYGFDSSGTRNINALFLKVTSTKDKLEVKSSLTYDNSGLTQIDLLYSGGAAIYCNGNLDLTATTGEQVKFSPPATTSGNILTNWEELANSLSNQPIEKMLNGYCKAFESSTRFTHKQAIDAIKKGHLYSFIPNISSMLNLYNMGDTYYDSFEYGITDYATIDFIGDYMQSEEDYGTYEDLFKLYNLTDSKQVINDLAFPTTQDTAIDKIIQLYKDKFGINFKVDDSQIYHYVTQYGNIFTDKAKYSINSTKILKPGMSSPIDIECPDYTITIQYDGISGHILYIYIEFPSSHLPPGDFRKAALSLANIVDPGKDFLAYSFSSIDYSSSIHPDDQDLSFTRSFPDKTGSTSLTIDSVPSFGELNDTVYYHSMSLFRESLE